MFAVYMFLTVAFIILAVGAASHLEYLDDGIEYDISPNIISPFPYTYRDVFRGHTFNSGPSPSPVNVVAPEVPKSELVSYKTSIVTTIASHAIACVSSAVSYLMENFTALALGTTAAVGICKLTSLCSQGDTLLLLQREIRSLATPQRIKRATEIVESAIRKYNALQ